ncbi:hypothetical protein P7C73_g934, partial [Tremellales sp. Uapishka_1]
MRMPAMSPTMTEGGITGWKKEEGESFQAGDVLLEVETDKATIDVEAQDDGVMGKIVIQAGSSKIPVGQIIAILAEEGDDLSAIEVPKDQSPEVSDIPKAAAREEPKAAAAPEPAKEEKPAKKEEAPPATAPAAPKAQHGNTEIKHPKPLSPSVMRLLLESSLTSKEISKLKGTGKHGTLTKGDVLLATGKIKSAWGSAEKLNLDIMGPSGVRKGEAKAATAPAKAPERSLTAMELRRLIADGLSKATAPSQPIVHHASNPLPLSTDAAFDSVLADYAKLLPPPQPAVTIPSLSRLAALEGHAKTAGKKDEWAGLF